LCSADETARFSRGSPSISPNMWSCGKIHFLEVLLRHAVQTRDWFLPDVVDPLNCRFLRVVVQKHPPLNIRNHKSLLPAPNRLIQSRITTSSPNRHTIRKRCSSPRRKRKRRSCQHNRITMAASPPLRLPRRRKSKTWWWFTRPLPLWWRTRQPCSNPCRSWQQVWSRFSLFLPFFKDAANWFVFFVKLQLAENFINWRGRLSH